MRSMKEVEQEYSQLILKAGQLQYQVKIGQDDLSLLNEQLKDLNFEAAAINAAAKKAADEVKAGPSLVPEPKPEQEAVKS